MSRKAEVILLLFSLLLLSYIIAPIREIANKQFSFTLATTSNSTMTFNLSNMKIDIDSSNIREKSTFFSKVGLRSSSISLSTSFISYHQCMAINNDLSDIEIWKPIDSSQLSYKKNIKVEDSVRTATDKDFVSERQHACNKTPALKKTSKPHGKGKGRTVNRANFNTSENMINIQLPYNINQSTKPDT